MNSRKVSKEDERRQQIVSYESANMDGSHSPYAFIADTISNIKAKLVAENRYDRLTSDVQKLTGKPSMSVREYVAAHREVFSAAAVTD
jgi:hypothetical protein